MSDRNHTLKVSRKLGQNLTIRCPDGATLTVAIDEIMHDRVRIAIGAPREYHITRDEAKIKEPQHGAKVVDEV